MIRTIMDVFQMYLAMGLYYILQLPYAPRIALLFVLVYGLAVIAIVIIFSLGKKIFLPCLLYILEYLIRAMQRITLWVVRYSPTIEDRGADFDDKLNVGGIQLENWRKQLKAEKKVHLKKVPIGKLFFVLSSVVCILVIAPFYMERSVSGNAKQICADINGASKDMLNSLWHYTTGYYTPAVRPASEKVAEPRVETEKKIILHLGASGVNGANLRSSPKMGDDNKIKSVSGDVELLYENEVQTSGGATWIKISMDDLEEAWINIGMIKKEDLAEAGIVR